MSMTDKDAIENLKGQIKCHKCETGIDCEKCRPNWSIKNDIEALNKGIKALENQKTGHWIFKNDNIAIPTGYYQCSECEEGKLLNKDNFCPNCGAKMEGENKKECSTCKSDNSHENCLGCIEYGHWELKGENNENSN